MLISSAKQSVRSSNNESTNFNSRLCRNLQSMTISARFQTELLQLEQQNEPFLFSQQRSTLSSVDFSRQISSKQSCRSSMPNININGYHNPCSKRKNDRMILRTTPCLIYMPGLKREDIKEDTSSQLAYQKQIRSPLLKTPIKHISFQFRNRDKCNPLHKIN
ncbi:unnamed protein product (macronuclear) [Paramecium tetraurelia]|uniref:Uncharacterized protein n=1 Tax=Paramecium tetraurelia TaxID=5888 RepID=A0D1F0_PARTE|nr:uncharacterized protein GSPATT00012391001 [Paramecium tetraurelia]CAK76867.1 unnamed protein product [Paramecium tetraurelia]|eukprot:XP_001444264.1 hypothetical protein (macronuclear) [Paramecium tetraurelia strain d4-2]